MSRMYDLIPTDGHKSFYGKAKVEVSDDGREILYSYNTPIIVKYPDGNLLPLYHGDMYRNTTARHVKAFCGISKAEYRKLGGRV